MRARLAFNALSAPSTMALTCLLIGVFARREGVYAPPRGVVGGGLYTLAGAANVDASSAHSACDNALDANVPNIAAREPGDNDWSRSCAARASAGDPCADFVVDGDASALASVIACNAWRTDNGDDDARASARRSSAPPWGWFGVFGGVRGSDMMRGGRCAREWRGAVVDWYSLVPLASALASEGQMDDTTCVWHKAG